MRAKKWDLLSRAVIGDQPLHNAMMVNCYNYITNEQLEYSSAAWVCSVDSSVEQFISNELIEKLILRISSTRRGTDSKKKERPGAERRFFQRYSHCASSTACIFLISVDVGTL